jgi:hypothetical protein
VEEDAVPVVERVPQNFKARVFSRQNQDRFSAGVEGKILAADLTLKSGNMQLVIGLGETPSTCNAEMNDH